MKICPYYVVSQRVYQGACAQMQLAQRCNAQAGFVTLPHRCFGASALRSFFFRNSASSWQSSRSKVKVAKRRFAPPNTLILLKNPQKKYFCLFRECKNPEEQLLSDTRHGSDFLRLLYFQKLWHLLRRACSGGCSHRSA